jgi:hypothetical protein
MTDIKSVTITVARPQGSFPGKVETGWYTVNDGIVMLVHENGVPVDRYKFTRRLTPGANPKCVQHVAGQIFGRQVGRFQSQAGLPEIGILNSVGTPASPAGYPAVHLPAGGPALSQHG